MLQLDNFRITKIDKYNICFDEYRDVESNITKKVEKKWIRIQKYYSTLEQCLEGIKNHIISNYAEKINDYNELLQKINELNGAIIKCKLVGIEDEKIE